MNRIRMAALVGFLAIGTVITDAALAEESTTSAQTSISQTISQIEQAINYIGESDFNAAQVHMKAARSVSESLDTNEKQVKKANALVIQGQIQAKKGDIEKATAELNKALEIYRSR